MSDNERKNVHIDSIDPLSGDTDWTLDIVNDLFDDDITRPHEDDLVEAGMDLPWKLPK